MYGSTIVMMVNAERAAARAAELRVENVMKKAEMVAEKEVKRAAEKMAARLGVVEVRVTSNGGNGGN